MFASTYMLVALSIDRYDAIARPLNFTTTCKYPMLLCVFFVFFSVRLLSVLRGHSVFSSPPQRPVTSDFEGFSIPNVIHYIYFPILILEKAPVVSLLNVQCLTRALLEPRL